MEAAVIDPGGDLPASRQVVQRPGLGLRQIMLTHAHVDHAGGNAELARDLALPSVGPHAGDLCWIEGLRQQALPVGFPP